MKNKIKQFLVYSTPILLLIIFLIFFYYTSREVKFEEVLFEDDLENTNNESSPHNAFFTLSNHKFNPVDCKATLILKQEEVILNETTYDLAIINARTKLKYQIFFNMPKGETYIQITKDCIDIKN